MTSAVRFFLSRALSPHVQAGSRWTAVNALSRRAFVVAGKDSGSPFLGWLAGGRTAGVRELEAAAEQLGLDDCLDVGGFLGWYRRLNFDYPFLDYAEAGPRIDARLMDAYSAAEPQPSPARDTSGHELPITGVEISGAAPTKPEEALLAAWLRVAAGFSAASPGRRALVKHRTSPSGGARHPTELGVSLGAAWGALRGEWCYDSDAHMLEPGRVPYVTNEEQSPACAVFTVFSRVERAMWRYRDVRAFRPVLFDSGHVVETLMTVIRLTGWSARWVAAPVFVEREEGMDIAVGYVTASSTHDDEPAATRDAGREPLDGALLRTNPFVSLLFDDRLLITNHLEPQKTLAATAAMVDAIAYATPSSRRDRPTDPQSIVDATSLSSDELTMLREHGLLVDAVAGDRLWRGLGPWSSHDWYLSAVVHAEAVGCRAQADAPSMTVHSHEDDDLMVVRALDLRRTSRSLRALSLPADVAQRVLDVLSEQEEAAVIVSTPLGFGSMPTGVYAVSRGRIDRLRKAPLSDEEITRAAIGQPWARGFSCAIWLLPAFVDGTAADWESRMVACGRLAQRIALAAAHDPSVGVFQSPAMVDAELAELLEGRATLDGAYLVGLGITDGRDASDREILFRVGDLLRASA